MATGAPGSNGVWVYGEDDSEATFSALLNKAASTTNTQLGLDRARLTALEAAGRIVNVQSVTKSDTFSASVSPNTLTAITGLSVSITPKSSTNKILVTTHVHVANSGDGISLALKRNSSYIGLGNADGSRQVRTMALNPADTLASYRQSLVSMTFLDSPATTSSTTYSVDIGTSLAGVSRILYVNRSQNDDNVGSVPRVISSITVMEIAA